MTETQMWEAVRLLDGQTLTTVKGLPFAITVKGDELFVSRKNKSITRATVVEAYRRMVELQIANEPIDGPKKLGTFGASYIYPIFIRLGWINLQLPDEAMEQAASACAPN